ncbi:MAG: NAD-dependent malic enzyme [Candidatus Pacebacteria bacterium CG_4_10_14_0_8_um_filter_42_14]|nr:MAG: NAD-dependent malic enzyme [Candidatus Pacebacteria bacterium CG_4_10_14_0_8_um_filter_42_14]
MNSQALDLHKKYTGKLETVARMGKLRKTLLPLVYTPGVADVCRAISDKPDLAYTHTLKGRTVAVISDGSAVLGLGNIGPLAGLPVMEGKSLLLKEFGGVDSFPLVINTQIPEEIITFVRQVAPTFAGINLEDIKAPGCFQVEEALQDIGIPVFHDDQHGTAIVVKAALLNAAKVVGKPFSSLNVVIVGAGAAGLSVARMLLGLECLGKTCTLLPKVDRVNDVICVDRIGALVAGREKQNVYKQSLADSSNKRMLAGSLEVVAKNADVIIGVSGPGAIKLEIIKKMADKPIVFALANPIPEIDPELAKKAGAVVIATGRSNMPNQINNVLAFPGIFRAVIQGRLPRITQQMKQAAAHALAGCVTEPTAENIIPTPFHPGLADIMAKAVLKAK